MKQLLFFSFLVANIATSYGQADIPLKTYNQREPIFFVGFRPGFNLYGVGRKIKYHMSADGLNGHGQFFRVTYPRTHLSVSMMGEFEYRKKPFGIGLEGGLSAAGSTSGVAGVDEFLIIFSKNRYLNIRHQVSTVSPFIRLHTEQFSIQLGSSWNHWRIKADSTAQYQQYKGNTFGAVAGISIKIHDDGASRISLTGQYRYLGREKVGPFVGIGDNGDEVVLFKERYINLSHVLVGVSIDIGIKPKRYRT